MTDRPFDIKIGWIVVKNGDPLRTGGNGRAKSSKLYQHEKRAWGIAARNGGIVHTAYIKVKA